MTDQRDRSIETLLRQPQRDADAQSRDQCLAAESLAAWMEHELPADARGAVERHAAGCARCQALLAAIARTVPDVDAPPWWRDLSAKWFVPIAAVATALALWIFAGRGPLPSTSSKSPSIEASRDANRPDAANSPPVATPPATMPESSEKLAAQLEVAAHARARQGLADSNRLERETRAATDLAQRAAAPEVAGGIAGGRVARPQGQAAADSPARSPAPPAAAAVADLPSASPAAPSPMPPAANATSAEAKPTAAKPLAGTVTVPRDAVPSGVAGGIAGTFGGATFRTVDIHSPDPNYRWRIVAPASVQRSTDGGMTWTIVDPFPATTRVGAAVALTTGSSPSRDTCWIVGRLGLILLSTNGATWQRRAFPEQVDLTGVRASDAQRALVTTTDGRQFVTADGGATWTLVK